MRNLAQLHEEFNRNGIEFVNVDLDTALTMADIARSAQDDSEKRSRNTENARRAYDTIVYFSQRLRFTLEQERELRAKLSKLESALHELAETSRGRPYPAGE